MRSEKTRETNVTTRAQRRQPARGAPPRHGHPPRKSLGEGGAGARIGFASVALAHSKGAVSCENEKRTDVSFCPDPFSLWQARARLSLERDATRK